MIALLCWILTGFPRRRAGKLHEPNGRWWHP